MGYTLATTALLRSNTNAEFQAWGKQVSDAIANCGIVRESDANVGTQINWTTVEKPSAVNQSRGYEIYRFNDALQNTAPIYFKIEYGSSSSGAAVPSLWLTAGAGANTSGNITGNTTTRLQLLLAATPISSNTNTYYSGDTNRITVVLGSDTNYQITFGFERTLDASGAPTANGLNALVLRGGSSVNYQTLWTPAKGNVAPWTTNLAALTPVTGGLFANSGGHHIAFYRIYSFEDGVLYPPMTMFLIGFIYPFSIRDIITVPVNGVNTPYRILSNTAFTSVAPRSGGRATLFQRWD